MRVKSWRAVAREQMIWIGCSLMTGVLLFLILTSMLGQAFEREQRQAGLFWNGYVNMYVEQVGNWSRFESRLAADRYMRGSDKNMAVYVFDKDGVTRLAAAGSIVHDSSLAIGRKIPIFVQGETVGYTAIALTMQGVMKSLMYGIPSLFALLIYLAGMIHIRRQRTALERLGISIAETILQKAARKAGEALTSTAKSDSGQLLAGDRSADQQQAAVHDWMPLHEAAQEPLRKAMQEVDRLADKIERLETVRRTMVADIAHELRTPIAVMRTQLDNALHDGEPLPLPKIAALHDETLRLTRLVRDLQELSLAESGNLPLEKGWFSLTELVQSVGEALSVDAEERQLFMTVSFIDQPDIRIYADETRVRQIIINLIGNGLQHARSKLHIETRLVGSEAEVTVADDGWGIEEEEQSRVFDRFYRGKSGNRPRARTSGLGLGLAIAYQFSLAHNGTITLESRWGEGASFTLKLPVIDG